MEALNHYYVTYLVSKKKSKTDIHGSYVFSTVDIFFSITDAEKLIKSDLKKDNIAIKKDVIILNWRLLTRLEAEDYLKED